MKRLVEIEVLEATMRRLAVLWLGVVLSGFTQAVGVPDEITYQGTIRKNKLSFSGPIDVAFQIIDANGTVLWATPSPQPAEVVNGTFSTTIKPNGILWDKVDRPRLRVIVNSEVLEPAEPFRSAPYALMAGKVADKSITIASLEPDLQDRVIPTGMIGMFNRSCPGGWDELKDSQNQPYYGRFPRIGPSYGDVGGTETHNHSGLTGLAQNNNNSEAGKGSGNTKLHVHDIASDTHIPPFIQMMFCVKR